LYGTGEAKQATDELSFTIEVLAERASTPDTVASALGSITRPFPLGIDLNFPTLNLKPAAGEKRNTRYGTVVQHAQVFVVGKSV
jgi:hypothetical protein